MPTAQKDYTVRAVHCDWRSSDEEVYQALKRVTNPLGKAWDKLRKAKTIAIKFNQDKELKNLVLYEGHRQQLVDDSVVRATLRLLRENTTATVRVVDCSFYRNYSGAKEDTTQIRHVLREFGVEYVNGMQDVVWAPVPALPNGRTGGGHQGGFMFDQYPMPRAMFEADEVISVQKLKSHAFMGITLTTKNLFGLMPFEPAGRPRTYYHHLVRMPYMLADLARLYDPAMVIIDGMVCQAGEEWGKGESPRFGNCLLAGDNCVATDAVGATFMHHDPLSDWLVEPFHRDRNSLRVAAEGGYGEIDISKIDFESEVTAPVADFFAKITDSRNTVVSWRRTTAEQGLYYRDHRREFEKYKGEYILLQMGEVKWHDPSGVVKASRRVLSGDNPNEAMWMKYVDPDETEGEHYEVYEKTLDEVRQLEALPA